MNDLVKINKAVTQEDIIRSANDFADDYLIEFYSLDLAVIAKKLEIFADALRARCEEKAYADCGGGKMNVSGASISTTRPSPVYKYSETIELAELEIKERRKSEDEHIKALKRLEETDGTAIIVDYRKGQLKISIPK